MDAIIMPPSSCHHHHAILCAAAIMPSCEPQPLLRRIRHDTLHCCCKRAPRTCSTVHVSRAAVSRPVVGTRMPSEDASGQSAAQCAGPAQSRWSHALLHGCGVRGRVQRKTLHEHEHEAADAHQKMRSWAQRLALCKKAVEKDAHEMREPEPAQVPRSRV